MIANANTGEEFIERMYGMHREKMMKNFEKEKIEILMNFAKEECESVLKNNGVAKEECIIIIAKKT